MEGQTQEIQVLVPEGMGPGQRGPKLGLPRGPVEDMFGLKLLGLSSTYIFVVGLPSILWLLNLGDIGLLAIVLL